MGIRKCLNDFLFRENFKWNERIIWANGPSRESHLSPIYHNFLFIFPLWAKNYEFAFKSFLLLLLFLFLQILFLIASLFSSSSALTRQSIRNKGHSSKRTITIFLFILYLPPHIVLSPHAPHNEAERASKFCRQKNQ